MPGQHNMPDDPFLKTDWWFPINGHPTLVQVVTRIEGVHGVQKAKVQIRAVKSGKLFWIPLRKFDRQAQAFGPPNMQKPTLAALRADVANTKLMQQFLPIAQVERLHACADVQEMVIKLRRRVSKLEKQIKAMAHDNRVHNVSMDGVGEAQHED